MKLENSELMEKVVLSTPITSKRKHI